MIAGAIRDVFDDASATSLVDGNAHAVRIIDGSPNPVLAGR
jgi:hypothetical protein